MTYDDYRSRIIAAQEQWNRERDTIYDFTTRLAEGFHGEFELPRIPGPDNYDSMTLAQMVDAVDAMRPGTVREASEAWLNIGMNLTGAIEMFNQQFARTLSGDGMHSGWTGQSGQAAKDAVIHYSEQSQALASSASLVSFKLSEMHTGLNQTQALMPQVAERPDLLGKTLPKDGVMKAGDYTEEEATQEARRILRTVYGQVANQTDHGVPVLPSAPQIVADPGQPAGTSPDVPNSTGLQPVSDSGEIEPRGAQPTTAVPPSDSPQPGIPPATTPQSVTPAAVDQPTTAQPTTPGTPTTPSNINAPSPNLNPTPTPTPTPTMPGRSTGSNPNVPGRPGIPSTSNTPGAPGRGIPGGPLHPGAVPAATAASTAANRPGAAGMPGMAAPGAAGRGKGDEGESGTKDYLINQYNGEVVTGLDSLPKTVPPVIGGDHG
ncbi:hypothetical protein AB0C34_12285 [Nocardia sp. NPDC049220]|uniref:hypothetical protein n=1 Tax=Nocardia sp. NPDC049220 TaxID=3155273 RepID=UPI0033CC490D